MNRPDVERLRDARAYAQHAQFHAGGLDADILAGAWQPQHAALYALAVVGETLKRVSPSIRQASPDLPWRLVVDVRNIILHAYWQIDFEIIADVIEHRLDPLIAQLDNLIDLVENAQQ